LRFSPRIRAFAEIPLETAILSIETVSSYQQLAPKAFQLRQLGMSNWAIAGRLGVTDKAVPRAMAWLRRVSYCPDSKK